MADPTQTTKADLGTGVVTYFEVKTLRNERVLLEFTASNVADTQSHALLVKRVHTARLHIETLHIGTEAPDRELTLVFPNHEEALLAFQAVSCAMDDPDEYRT